MCEQMILTIFIIAVTLRAEAKLQVVPVQLRPAADRTFMLRSVLWLHLFHVTFELLSAVNLMRREPAEPPLNQEKYDKVEQGRDNRYPARQIALHQ